MTSTGVPLSIYFQKISASNVIVWVLFLENAGCIYTMQPKGFELSILGLIPEVVAHQTGRTTAVWETAQMQECALTRQ